MGRSTGQRDDPEGRNRVLGEDHGEKKGKDLTCGSGLEAGEARACGAGERSARAERVWGERRACVWAERDVVLAG